MKKTKDIERLASILAKGSKSRRLDAAYQLYWIFWYGEGVKADRKRAMDYLRTAAENGLADAMYQLGWHYDNGVFVRKNIVKAMEWYGKAADKGDAWAQVDLGEIYLDGERGVEKDYAQAVCLFRKAVRKKDELAFFNLGLWFGYFALVVLLCAFTIMSLGAFLYMLAGAFVIAVPAWISKRRRMRKESCRMAEVVARKSESLGSSRLRSVRGVALSLCEWAWEGLVGKEPYMIRSS